MVPTLWATIILVDPAVSFDSAERRSRSVFESRAEKVSSNRYIGGSFRTARAMDSLCFCPPDRFHPCCDTSESSPSGSLCTRSSNCAMRRARIASSSVPSAPP